MVVSTNFVQPMDLEILFDDSNYISLETYSLSFKKCVKKLYMKSVHL